jgi:hypothetical protein
LGVFLLSVANLGGISGRLRLATGHSGIILGGFLILLLLGGFLHLLLLLIASATLLRLIPGGRLVFRLPFSFTGCL